METLSKHRGYNNFIDLCELKMSEAPLVLEPTHKFCNGIYRRELFVPKGAFITSKVHLTTHFFELISGIMDVATQDGVVRMVAPYDCITYAGDRKIGYAIEDCLMATYHRLPDDCEDIEMIEKRLFKEYDNPLLREAKMEVINK